MALCEYEDFNNPNCINCFNGLPTTECKKYEEMEGKKLRQMVHERAERDRKKTYNKAIDDMLDNIIINSRTEMVDGKITLIITEKEIKTIAEKMKTGPIERKE